jgi:hypothetical protein
MVLAQDVENYKGARILTKGAILTDALIALLHHWKVAEVFVDPELARVEPAPAPVPETDWALERAKKRLAEKFDGNLVNDWMKALLDETEKRLERPKYWDSSR